MNPIIDIKNISKSFGEHQALSDVSLSVPEGSIFGLLGPNGAGKTTLLRIVNQIILPDNGEVLFENQPLKKLHVKDIGYMPEERGLYNSMKVGEQAVYLAQLKGMTKTDAVEKLKFWFKKLDIIDWWDKKIQELSKGMAQKIQFIVTVVHEPKLLIFDEPFSGFDPINAEVIRDEILELSEKGATIIFSTHRMESVEELCEYIALINKSKCILQGKLLDIKRAYRTNTFRLGLLTDNKAETKQVIEAAYPALPTNFKSIDDELKLEVQLEEADTNGFLSFVSKLGRVTHFEEVIPSANDIFIQTVKNN